MGVARRQMIGTVLPAGLLAWTAWATVVPSRVLAQDARPYGVVAVNAIRRIQQEVRPLRYPQYSLGARYGLDEHFYCLGGKGVVSKAAKLMEISGEEWHQKYGATYRNLDDTFPANLAKSRFLYFGQYSTVGCVKSSGDLFTSAANRRAVSDLLRSGGIVFFDYYGTPMPQARAFVDYLGTIGVEHPGPIRVPEKASRQTAVVWPENRDHPLARGIGKEELLAYGSWGRWSDKQLALFRAKNDASKATLIVQEGVLGKGRIVFSQIVFPFREQAGRGVGGNRTLAENVLALAFGPLRHIRARRKALREAQVIMPAKQGPSGHDFVGRGERTVASGDCRTFQFPAVHLGRGQKVVLELEVRLESPVLGGVATMMGLALNGRAIAIDKAHPTRRLLNRPFLLNAGSRWLKDRPVYERGRYLVYYAANFQLARDPYNNSYPTNGGDPYFYALDVTDLVRAGGPNRLQVRNPGIKPKGHTWATPGPALAFKTLRLRTLDRGETYVAPDRSLKAFVETDPSLFVRPMRVVSPSQETVPGVAPKARHAPFDVAVDDGGGLALVVGGRRFPVRSSFTYPHGGAHPFGGAPAPGRKNTAFKIAVRHPDADTWRVSGACKHYTVTRTISRGSHRVTVEDTFTNTSPDDVGIIIENGVCIETVDALYLGGQKALCAADSSCSNWRAMNHPTAFFTSAGTSLGMVALDDVYRVQAELFLKRAKAVGIATRSFALAKGASYTIRWALYPMSGDYFAFVNTLRADEGLNRRVDGCSATAGSRIQNMPPDVLRRWCDLRGLKYLIVSTQRLVPGLITHGAEILKHPSVREELKALVSRLHRIVPHVKVLIYIEPQLNTEPDSPRKYPDSVVTRRNGEPWSNDYRGYFTPANRAKGYGTGYFLYSTLDNRYHQALCKIVDLYMDEVGADGVYIDDFMGMWLETFDRWDGHTALIDPKTQTIVRKVGRHPLLRLESIKALIRRIRRKGGEIIVNGSAGGTWTLSREPFFQFVEAGQPSWYHRCSMTHLFPSPISLGLHGATSQQQVIDDIRAKLNRGALYYYYHSPLVNRRTITSQMYPITVQELHAGTIKGKERILTTKGGVYGWQTSQLNLGYRYDRTGLLVPNTFLTTVDARGARTRVDLGPDQMAALVKVPVWVKSAEPVNLVFQQYDSQGVQLTVNGTGKVVVQIRAGRFPIEPGASYRVTAKRPCTVKPDQGTLTIALSLCGQEQVRVDRAR